MQDQSSTRTCKRCQFPFSPKSRQQKFCSRSCWHEYDRANPENFWRQVNKTDDCWIWTGHKRKDGYGGVTVDGKGWIASRYSYVLAYGSIPDGLLVLHKCDNPPCVRPDHLFLGTVKDNGADKACKGRSLRGERNGHARLTTDQVREIKRRLACKERGRRIAEAFGIPEVTVSAIKCGRIWAHLP